ncbi:unnamed protein product [Closterium sp. NIES-53]
MLALCREHRLEHRTKHVALRYFLARELQQRGQLRLAYMACEANTADIFTKALAPGDHQRFCTLLARHRDDVDYQCRLDAAVAGDARHHYRRSNRRSVGAHQERGVPEGACDRDVGVHGGRDEAEAVGFFLAEDRAERGVPASSMVVLDSYRGHPTQGVKEKFRELNCMPAIIPSGCMAEVQPLDVCINKSFKASVRQQYQKWFQEEGQEQLTIARNLKKPPPEVVVRWISRAWKAVPADLIKRAFLTCGISNALDGSEDGLAMAHRRSQLTAEVDVDDSIIADGFFGNKCQEPESDEE